MSASVPTAACQAGRMRRINLLRAHGSPTNYQHKGGCRCVACRAARAEYDRKYRAENLEEEAAYGHKYRAEHREERAEYQRLYYAEHRNEHLEERAEYNRKYQAEHKEELAEYKRKHRAGHREEVAEYGRKYKAEHREEFAAYSRNRRALEANATGTHTAADVKTQYERQRGKCFWRNVNPDCVVSLKGGHHVDHVIPLAGDRTSSNGPENIVLSCPSCNRRKSAKDPMDWSGMML